MIAVENACAGNMSEEELTKGAHMGACDAIISVEKKSGDAESIKYAHRVYNLNKNEINYHIDNILSTCGNGKMTKECFYKLPEDTRYFFNYRNMAIKELNSSTQMSIINKPCIGTDSFCRGMVYMAFCKIFE